MLWFCSSVCTSKFDGDSWQLFEVKRPEHLHFEFGFYSLLSHQLLSETHTEWHSSFSRVLPASASTSLFKRPQMREKEAKVEWNNWKRIQSIRLLAKQLSGPIESRTSNCLHATSREWSLKLFDKILYFISWHQVLLLLLPSMLYSEHSFFSFSTFALSTTRVRSYSFLRRNLSREGLFQPKLTLHLRLRENLHNFPYWISLESAKHLGKEILFSNINLSLCCVVSCAMICISKMPREYEGWG